jgi:hypothetical protein
MGPGPYVPDEGIGGLLLLYFGILVFGMAGLGVQTVYNRWKNRNE